MHTLILLTAVHHPHYSLAPGPQPAAGLNPAQVPWLIGGAICVLIYCVLALRDKSRPSQ